MNGENQAQKGYKKAVALQYNPQDTAPKVAAQGQGYMADRIVEKAKESQVAVYKDPELLNELYKIELGAHIPPELYEIVAQILIFVDDLDRLEEIRKNAHNK